MAAHEYVTHSKSERIKYQTKEGKNRIVRERENALENFGIYMCDM